ncbi:DUF2264 domain-containing protein [Tellurirhabdus rosea]|uniref:DUF2264 domain-containing protein n=1 Tax=Tellurirhabdus rosea TaxID=2674997 RepID=UPI00225BADB4|nr:DUF2264 domain-containing protein [Tellurirhabdus rosea]
MKRRNFLAGLALTPAISPSLAFTQTPPADDRAYWLQTLLKVAGPVLTAAAAGQLKDKMPVESAPKQLEGRKKVTYLEALGRTLTGLSPWLDAEVPAAERSQQQRFGELARQAIARSVDPQAPTFLNFTSGGQPLVDAAFLAHALLRAPKALWEKLDARTQQNLVAALTSTRAIKPGFNNWLLFSGMVEAALLRFTGKADEMRLDYALRQHEQWYKGDGAYGDGPNFHWDYYNSFVIQPMMLDIVRTMQEAGKGQKGLYETVLARAQRYAVIQERMIAPDGSFAAYGRSLAYRCGAFQHLAQMALQKQLPAELTPAQVRSALTAVIRRTMEAPGTYDGGGWLQIGLCGHQPSIGETYISTGSLYLCTAAFVPLGLPADDPFWSNPAQDWTARKIWSGQDIKADHAY